MSKHSYRVISPVGIGRATVRAGEVALTDEQAAPLLANGSIERVAGPATAPKPAAVDLIALDAEAFDAAIGGMKLAELQAAVAERGIDAGSAKTKADFAALLQAAWDEANGGGND